VAGSGPPGPPSSSGTPKWTSFSIPSGTVTTSRSHHDKVRPVAAARSCRAGSRRSWRGCQSAARLPPGLGLDEHRAHVLPVAQLLDRRVVRRSRQPRGVQQHVPERDPVLAVDAELGPDLSGPQVVGELASLHQHTDDGRGHALGCGCGPEQRVGTYGLPLARVRGTAHRIHHDPAVLHHCDLHPDLVAAPHPVADQRLDARLHIGSAHAVILPRTDRPMRVTRKLRWRGALQLALGGVLKLIGLHTVQLGCDGVRVRSSSVGLGSAAPKRPKRAMAGVLGLVSIIILFVPAPRTAPRSRLAPAGFAVGLGQTTGPLRARHRRRGPPHERDAPWQPNPREGRTHRSQLPPGRRGRRPPAPKKEARLFR
jgi:hypothetical protein